jgi:hypothetical protein
MERLHGNGRAIARCSRMLAVALCGLALTTGTGALAQDAPVDGAAACIDVATPAIETVLQEVYDSTPVAGTPEAEPAIAVDALPEGTPVDEATAAAADQVVRTWLACLLSGEALAELALQSDAMDDVFVAELDLEPEAFENLLTYDLDATPIPLEPAIVISTGSEIRALADGRIGGIWSLNGDAAFITLMQEDGAWVIDGGVDLIDAATPTP